MAEQTWQLDKEYALKGGGKMVPKAVDASGIKGTYIRPDTVDGGTWRGSRWNLDGSHAGGLGGEAPDPVLDIVGPLFMHRPA